MVVRTDPVEDAALRRAKVRACVQAQTASPAAHPPWLQMADCTNAQGVPCQGRRSAQAFCFPAHTRASSSAASSPTLGPLHGDAQRPRSAGLSAPQETLVAAAGFFGPEAVAKVTRLTVRKLYQREYHFFDSDGKGRCPAGLHARAVLGPGCYSVQGWASRVRMSSPLIGAALPSHADLRWRGAQARARQEHRMRL